MSYKNNNILSFIIFTSVQIYLIVNITNNRSLYENYLLSQYSTIPSYSESQLNDIPKPEHPHIGKFQDRFMTIDPDLGYVPFERLQQSFIETQNIYKNNRNTTRDISWSNIPSNMGGRTRTLMYDPNTPNKVWAGGVTGGLWFNDNILDDNSNWQPVDDFWSNISVSKIIHDPNNPEIFYVSTGEANTAIITYRESSSKGIGIWKSVDAGNTWNLIESTQEFEYITDIEIRNSNGISELYAGVVSGTYQGEEHNSSPSDGLYKSVDGGISWVQILPLIDNINENYSPADIEINSNGRIFVGTMKNINGNGGAVILYSDNGDINTWNIIDSFKEIIENDQNYNIPGRIVLSSCNIAPEIIYAVIGSGFVNNMNFNLSYGNYIIKSIDEGDSWDFVNLPTENGNDWASLAWHALSITVHPNDPETIFVGGLELYKSINGGDSWNDLSDWSLMYYGGGDRYVHADIHQIVFNPNNINESIIATDGGLFLSSNIHDYWANVVFTEKNNGYNTLQFYTCDIAPLEYGNSFVGGLQDNGTLVSGILDDDDGSFDINDMVTGGDGAYCFFDNNDPLLITSTYYNAWYFINHENNDYQYENNNSGVFINPADYDSYNNTLYANKVRFNGTQNQRIIIAENINPYDLNDNINFNTLNLYTGTSVYYSTLKIFNNNESTDLYIGTQSGRLFKVSNINNAPLTVEIGSGNFPTANISSINISDSGNLIFITFSNYGVSSIWLTVDGGNNWIEKEGNLPDMPVRYGLLHPNDSNYALIATEIGIWECNNLLEEQNYWYPSISGLANVRVDMLSIRPEDNMVVAATHGRGLFYGIFDSETTILGDINLDNYLNVLDIVLLVNIIITDNEYNYLGDLNQDFIINVLDVVLLVNLILE